jgi:hypothetical protein
VPKRVSPEDLPKSVRELLERRIEALEQREVLLLLHEWRDRSWTLQAVGECLRHSAHIGEALRAIQKAGLILAVTTSGTVHYVYSPVSPRLDQAVGELARYYRDKTTPIMKVLNGDSIQRLRTGGATPTRPRLLIPRGDHAPAPKTSTMTKLITNPIELSGRV